MESDAMRCVKLAKERLQAERSVFGVFIIECKLIEDLTCTTAWTDGNSIGFNPDFILGLTPSDRMFVLAHEALHIMLAHHLRAGFRDHQRWNKATDKIINLILKTEGFSVDDRWLLGDSLSKDAERYYLEEEEDKPEDQQDADEGDDNGAEGSSGEDWDDESEEEGSESDGDSSSSPGEDDSGSDSDGTVGEDGQQGNSSNGASGDQPSDIHPEDVSETGSEGAGEAESWEVGEVRQAEIPEGSTPSQEESKVMDRMMRSKAIAKQRGNLSVGMLRLIEDLLDPPMDLTQLMEMYFDEYSMKDYNPCRPMKRYLPFDMQLPSLRSNDINTVVVAIDTSGSVSSEQVDEFGSMISPILERYGAAVHVIYCDTAMTVETFEPYDLPLDLHPTGGGGTDFKPPFEWVESEYVDPTIMIYFTDLACSSYPDEPNYPVLWVVSEDDRDGYYTTAPPFGEVVYY